jgi:hypothetical protein
VSSIPTDVDRVAGEVRNREQSRELSNDLDIVRLLIGTDSGSDALGILRRSGRGENHQERGNDVSLLAPKKHVGCYHRERMGVRWLSTG